MLASGATVWVRSGRYSAMLRTSWRYEGEERSPTSRLEALADGVFAIVMTLLVLELGVPVVADRSNSTVTEALGEMWPEFLIYALSFLVLGVFWLIHKMIFDSIEESDPQLIWLNVWFLLVTALLPFTTALVGEYRAMAVAAALYGLNILLAFVSAWSIWAYATFDRRLTAPDLDAMLIKGGNRMGVAYAFVFAVAAALAFVSPQAAYAAIGVLVGTIITFTMLGRWETVMVWAKPDDSQRIEEMSRPAG
jgi:uncharacterized membrane protein